MPEPRTESPLPRDLSSLRLADAPDKALSYRFDLKTFEYSKCPLARVTDGQREYFIKPVDPAEAEMQLRASQVNLGDNAIIRYAAVREINVSDLPPELQGYYKELGYSKLVILEKVPFDKEGLRPLISPENPEAFKEALQKNLRGKPITADEQKQIMAELKVLSEKGIIHGDLPSNISIQRDAEGKLHIYVIDPWPEKAQGDVTRDSREMASLLQDLQKSGAAEPVSLDMPGPQPRQATAPKSDTKPEPKPTQGSGIKAQVMGDTVLFYRIPGNPPGFAQSTYQKEVGECVPVEYWRKNYQILLASDLDPANEAKLLADHRKFLDERYSPEQVRNKAIMGYNRSILDHDGTGLYVNHLKRKFPAVMSRMDDPQVRVKYTKPTPDGKGTYIDWYQFLSDQPEFQRPEGQKRLYEALKEKVVALDDREGHARAVADAKTAVNQSLFSTPEDRAAFERSGAASFNADFDAFAKPGGDFLAIDQQRAQRFFDDFKAKEVKDFAWFVQESRKSWLEQARRMGLDDPYAPMLTPEQAREKLQQMVERMPKDSPARRMVEAALQDPSKKFVMVNDRGATAFYPGQRPCDGFSDDGKVIYLGANNDEPAALLTEEVAHDLIRETYRNRALPYPKQDIAPAEPRKKLLHDALLSDLRGDSQKERDAKIEEFKRDLGLSSYEPGEYHVEIPAKVLALMASGDWDKIKHKYPHIDRYMREVVIPDIEAYQQGKPLPAIDEQAYRMRDKYEGELRIYSEVREGKKVYIIPREMYRPGSAYPNELGITLRQLGVKQYTTTTDPRVREALSVLDPKLQGDVIVISAEDLERSNPVLAEEFKLRARPIEQLKADVQQEKAYTDRLAQDLKTTPEQVRPFVRTYEGQPYFDAPAYQRATGREVPVSAGGTPRTRSGVRRVLTVDGGGPGGGLALAVGLPEVIKNYPQDPYEQAKTGALVGGGGAGVTGQGLTKLTEGSTTRLGKSVRAAGKTLERIGWVANPALVVAGIDQWNAADERRSDLARYADKVQGAGNVVLGGEALLAAEVWLLGGKMPKGVGSVTGALNLGLIAFTVADEGGHLLLGRERFFDAIERTEVARQELQESEDQVYRLLRPGPSRRYVLTALPPDTTEYKQLDRTLQMMDRYGLGKYEDLKRLPPEELQKKLSELEAKLRAEFNAKHKAALDRYTSYQTTAGGYLSGAEYTFNAAFGGESVEKFNEAMIAQRQLNQDLAQISAAKDELGIYAKDKSGKEVRLSGPLPGGAKNFTERQRAFEKLKAADPELAADLEKIAPMYRKLALGQQLTPEEDKQLNEIIRARREAQMREMYRKHADFKAGRPGGMSASDYLKMQRKRAEDAGIAGTPLARMLLLTDERDVEAIVISNNLQGAREIAQTGKTDLLRLDMKEV